MSKINRRTALTLVGATAVTGAAAAGPQLPSKLDALIDAHRWAFDRFQEVVKSEERFGRDDEHRELFVQLSIGGAQSLNASRDLRDTASGFHKQIGDRYKGEQSAVTRIGRVSPELGMQANDVLRKAQANDLRTMRKVIREEQERREATGYAAFLREYDAAIDAENEALEVVLAYRCISFDELAMKAAYASKVLEGCHWERWQTEAFFGSMMLPAGGA